jgi:ATP-dependent DNA helicase RecQ
VRDLLEKTARERFGWDQLRAGQLEAMTAVMEGRDTLGVMPTGAGKSAIFQVPALLLDGPTVVVSPLIFLQHDQVAGLMDSDAGPVGARELNSTIRHGEREDIFAALAAGDLEYLFLAPEQRPNGGVNPNGRLPSLKPSSSRQGLRTCDRVQFAMHCTGVPAQPR